MENELVCLLEGLELSHEFEVILQGTLDPESSEPENFFTYWCWDNERDGYYNNKNSRNLIGYQITAYSTDRLFLIEMMDKAITELEKNNYIISDDETDVSSNDKNYTARMIDVYFIKKKEV